MCNLCSEYLYVIICYAMVGCCAVSCPKNFSDQSDPVSFCASDNKRLVTCNLSLRCINLRRTIFIDYIFTKRLVICMNVSIQFILANFMLGDSTKIR